MRRLDAITLKQLRALHAVASQGSLTAAAAEIGQTVPAIHSQIKNLENAVGVPILVRPSGAGPTELTPEGEEVLRAATRIEGILSQAADQIRARATGQIGHVTISVVSTSKYFAPGLVKILSQTEPEIGISLRVGNRESVIADLDDGRCELAIMGRPPRVPAVRSLPLGPHPHGVILPIDHPFAQEDGFDPALLVQETFLSRERGSGTRILMQRFLDRFEEGPVAQIVEMDSNETIKQAVRAGLGIALLSLHTVHDELQEGRLAQLRGLRLPIIRHWYLVWPAHVERGPAATRIAERIEKLNGTFLPGKASV
ncbi:MAG: LysR family transcriptional regulator [Paracoccaceae bacterium]